MATKNEFINERNIRYTQRTRAIIQELPTFCGEFFRSAGNNTTVLTRYAYAVDLRSFFLYTIRCNELFLGRALPSLTVADLAKIERRHVEMYLEDVSLYYKEGNEVVNQERAKARKLSTLRAFFKYYFKQELIPSNVAALVEAPKLHQKAIIRLEPNEVASLLDAVEHAEGMSEREKMYHQHTRTRDIAIMTLFLGTGIRISELVGLNMDEIDFESNSFLVTRKGGSQDTLHFGDEVHNALYEYCDWRSQQIPADGHEDALFLSLQMRRVSVRCVENLVKKYAKSAKLSKAKDISPHKLRSTFGTMLYHESQDIYLVADVLGHKDVNTTKKHYAAASEDNKRRAAKMIKLRDD